MALVLLDRVQETGTANTTVSFTLTGAVTGFETFAAIGNGNTTFYAATDATGNWEVGVGTYSTTGPTLTRTTILSSSNAGSAETFSGTVNVFVTYPAGKSVNLNAAGNVSALGTVTSGTWNGSTIPVAYGGTGVTASSGANSVVLRDTNQNVTFSNFTSGFTAVTAAAGTTVLTVASTRTQVLIGSTTQTIQLPDATTLQIGQSFIFVNNSSGALTITNNATAVIEVIPPGGSSQIGATSIATVAGTWGIYSFLPGTYNFSTPAADFGNATISNAVWNGTTIGSAYGGTGLTTFAAANNALFSTGASTLTAGTLPVAAGGTGATTLTGLVVGNGTSAMTTVTAPSGAIVGTTDTQTLTNKRVTPRIGTVASAATITPTSDASDQYNVTALATTAAFAIPSGTPTDGQKLSIRIYAGTTQTISWDTTTGGYRVIGTTLPLSAPAGKTIYVGCVYNSADTFWDVVAVATQA